MPRDPTPEGRDLGPIGMERKGQAGDTMVLPLEAFPRVSSSRLLAGEAEVALKTGVWTGAEGRGGRNCKSQLMAWEELVTKEAITTPLVPIPPPPTPTACLQLTPRVP